MIPSSIATREANSRTLRETRLDIPPNLLKQKLRAGRPQFGIHARIPYHYAVEVLAGAGFGWVMIDAEHSPNDLESVLLQLHAIGRYSTSPVVHLPSNDPVVIKRFLDIGVQTLLVPNVATAEEAQAAVAYTRYPPAGLRGLANVTRASCFGRIKDYAKAAQQELCVFVMVETQAGLNNLDAICAVEGVDGVFIGPADLHASLGHAGATDHPGVMAQIDEAIVRIRAKDKAPGVFAPVESHARRWLSCGALMIAVGADIRLLTSAADALASTYGAYQ